MPQVRLIDENNEQAGVVDTSDALRRAEGAGLDLVEISPESNPPVCKIMDYGKYKYEKSKKDQRTRAASKQAEMKEVRLGRSIKIDPHDVQIRIEQARKFLMDGHKVLLVQQFRGREMAHRELGVERLRGIVEALADISKVEMTPRQAGRRLSLMLAPDRNKVEKAKQRAEQLKRDAAMTTPSDMETADEPNEAPPAPLEVEVESTSEQASAEQTATSGN